MSLRCTTAHVLPVMSYLPPGHHLCSLQVTIGSTELKANHMIQQDFQFPMEHDKYPLLLKLLEREMDGRRILIFCETKRGCDTVTRQLRQNGYPALSIHGDKSQQERDWVLGVSPEACVCGWISLVWPVRGM